MDSLACSQIGHSGEGVGAPADEVTITAAAIASAVETEERVTPEESEPRRAKSTLFTFEDTRWHGLRGESGLRA